MKCQICHIGTLHRKTRTHTRWAAGTLILVPNVEIFVCDVCNEIVETSLAPDLLENLLGNQLDSAGNLRSSKSAHNVVVVTSNQRRST